MYRHFFKRLIDFVVSLVAFLVLSPLFLVITGALFIANDGKPFFFQARPGRRERIFKVIKFKTMNDRRDQHGALLPDADRLTSFGRFVRRTSLDEIPQLLNVIKGDMSLIGPRPLLVDYLPLYNDRQKRRHEIRPGITGWAQVNGRNAIGWDQKFDLDVWYVDHYNFKLDCKIVWMTIAKVAKAEGISSSTSATMERFMGSNQNHHA